MGVSYRGWRKALIVAIFITPTLLAVFGLSIFPIFYNVYASFTTRTTFRPRTNCEGAEVQGADGVYQPTEFETWLTNVMEPNCWGVFKPPVGRGGVYGFADPLSTNYSRLLGELFTSDAFLSMAMLLLGLSPLMATYFIRRYYSRQMTAPRMPWIWPAAFLLSVLFWNIFNVSGAVARLQDTGDFFFVLYRTILYVIACIPLFFVTGLILALILNNDHIRGRGLWRATLILPWAVQSYIAALVWQFFFRGEVGTINQFISALGIWDRGPTWLGDPTRPWLAFVAVVVINLWMSYPFFTVIILGALQSIPNDQYEAADVDGATWWDKLTLITLPLLRPAVLPAVVLSSITTFQMFNTVWLVTQGGPTAGAGKPGYTEFVMLHAYELFQDQNYGRMGAFAVIIFLMLFIATILSLRVTRITQGAYE